MRLLVTALVSTVGLAVAQPALAEGGFDPGRAAQSLCSTPVGLRLGADCVSRLTSLLTTCKAQASTQDSFKACVQAQLPAGTGRGDDRKRDFDPGRAVQSLCQGPIGQKLGADCVARLTSLLTTCKAQASTQDAFKACVSTQLPTLTTTAPKRNDFDPARLAQYLCKSPVGAKLGGGCVTRLTALVTSCKAQSPAGDTWKSCVAAQLRPDSGETTRKQR
jgi:hypothetical protein